MLDSIRGLSGKAGRVDARSISMRDGPAGSVQGAAPKGGVPEGEVCVLPLSSPPAVEAPPTVPEPPWSISIGWACAALRSLRAL
jgi:hypothetical protein